MNNFDGIKKIPREKVIRTQEIIAGMRGKTIEQIKPKINTISQNPLVVKKHFLESFIFLLKKSRYAVETMFNVLTISFLLITAVYAIFFLVVVHYKIDNKLSRLVEKIMPIPAMIVDNKFIDYYHYIDLSNESENGTKFNPKYQIIKQIITKNFFYKYKTDDINTLNKLIIADRDANAVGLSRIGKIKKLLDEGGDFDKIMEKYSEKRGFISINDSDLNQYEYGDKINNLEIGQLSNVINTSEGYYVFKCLDKKNNTTDFSYAFIEAKNFEQYLNEIIENVYYISFVD